MANIKGNKPPANPSGRIIKNQTKKTKGPKKGMPTKTPKSSKVSNAKANKTNQRPGSFPARPAAPSNSADTALAQLMGGSNV